LRLKGMKRYLFCIFADCLSAALVQKVAARADPLPSWNNGTNKQAIVNFVTKVTKEGGLDFVSPTKRIATFDNNCSLPE
jgi:hypothetical protein